MKIAGILPTRDYNDDCKTFETLKRLCDITIVLDHNSKKPFPFREECTEYITLQDRGPWHDLGNRGILFWRAFIYGCKWILRMDDDFMVSSAIKGISQCRELIGLLDERGRDGAMLPLRDLWDSPYHYRSDTLWGKKQFPLFQRNFFFDQNISVENVPETRLHRTLQNAQRPVRWLTVPEPYCIYHTGCMSPVVRKGRVEKYDREDSGRMFQADYSYMLDEADIQLTETPPEDLAVFPASLKNRFTVETTNNSNQTVRPPN